MNCYFQPKCLKAQLGDVLNIQYRSLDKRTITTKLTKHLGHAPSEDEVNAALRTLYMDRLGLRRDFEALKANLDTRMRELITKDPYLDLESLRADAKKILLGLTYLDHYYSYDFAGHKAKDLILFDSQEALGAPSSPALLLERLASVGYVGASPLATSQTFSRFIHPTAVPITEWIGSMVQKYEPNTSIDDWLKEHTKAVIHEEGKTPFFNKMAMNERLRAHLLPLLALSSPSVYVLSVDHAVTYGLTGGYGGPSAELDDRLAETAKKQQAFVDLWHRISQTNQAFSEGSVVVVRDGMFMHPKDQTHPTASSRWSDESGPNADLGVVEFFAPMKLWARYQFIGGQASPVERRIDLVLHEALSDDGVNTFTHEMTHIFDQSVWFNGHVRRDGVKIEAYARGFFESVNNTQPSEGEHLNMFFSLI